MLPAGLYKSLHVANQVGSLAGCDLLRAASAIAMLEYKLQNPADTPADIMLLTAAYCYTQ
jgi:hypothetical protein